jgi:hypothetical protein
MLYRIPLFLCRKSNHIFTVWWQHIVLLVVMMIRQYEGKNSYRLFVDWLVEAYYLRIVLRLSHIPHYTTLQKFAARINGTILAKKDNFLVYIVTDLYQQTIHRHRLIHSSGFKVSNQCFTLLQIRPNCIISILSYHLKLSLSADLLAFSNYMYSQNKMSSHKT